MFWGLGVPCELDLSSSLQVSVAEFLSVFPQRSGGSCPEMAGSGSGVPGSAGDTWRPCCARCSKCNRPAALFGSFDERTGWRGWCDICNWHWHHPDAVPYRVWHRSMERRSKLAGEVLGLVGTFLIDSKRAHADFRSIKDRVLRKRWTRMLTSGPSRKEPCIRDIDGEIRSADSDDEIEGMLDPYLNWVNPLWKLQLAPEPSPMEILVQFLGMGTPLD